VAPWLRVAPTGCWLPGLLSPRWRPAGISAVTAAGIPPRQPQSGSCLCSREISCDRVGKSRNFYITHLVTAYFLSPRSDGVVQTHGTDWPGRVIRLKVSLVYTFHQECQSCIMWQLISQSLRDSDRGKEVNRVRKLFSVPAFTAF
jgi:hypothetical protein